MRLPLLAIRFAIALASLFVILVSILALAIFITFDHEAAEYTTGGEPIQFYRQLDADLLDDYRGVFGVAHNSGNLVGTIKEALDHGADVIEIDVISVGGRLRAAHRSPVPIIGSRLFRGPTLEEVWEAAAAADVIKLDLKKSSPEFLERLVDFLSQRMDHEVVISTRDPEALNVIAEQVPQVIRLLSIPDVRGFEKLREGEDLQTLIDGVTIRHTALNEERVTWLRERGLVIFAWTVNDMRRVNELVTWGVHAVNTDNLAIMELLGGQERGEATLRSLVSR
ncbi:MAG: glycerophosphodiester phosphodiesterase [Dehalococcoidia bacterium]